MNGERCVLTTELEGKCVTGVPMMFTSVAAIPAESTELLLFLCDLRGKNERCKNYHVTVPSL